MRRMCFWGVLELRATLLERSFLSNRMRGTGGRARARARARAREGGRRNRGRWKSGLGSGWVPSAQAVEFIA
eukprot:305758-Amorphochlora_amoeboformis.AAC.2